MSRGKRLKEARLEVGWSQKEMAEKLKISQPSYGYFEKNDNAAFSSELMSLIIELGINLNWVITGYGSMLLASKSGDASNGIESIKRTEVDNDVEEGFVEEMEERIRRLKVDAMDIEETFRRMLRRKKG